ncbi:peptidase C14 caspase catalytic subunit p20 [Candidatus Thiomargarita nelsonii]|uniref:Peptidase C14 caspase catalytic subunit p20 n=1 Tax=Candidatus Thiomargarita nelsonii TaxID=1003181 RepID=A0A176RZC4_9GAMM|nr:peptidase C14 caspase catalytic subunit p20 [Candidatus Thiomargarita nelsonii]
MDGPTGTFIAYATAAGEVADDGKGRNSPFTKNLLWALETIPHLMVGELFKKVAQKMIEEQVSGEKSQIPWRHSSIIGDFCFAACPGVDVSQQLRECKKHFQANRLTTGKGGTAFVCYRDVLTKDPNNVEAKAGLKEIEDRYVAWINRALKRGQRYKAKRYLPRLCKVNPKSPNLTEIKAQLGTSCPQLTRTATIG